MTLKDLINTRKDNDILIEVRTNLPDQLLQYANEEEIERGMLFGYCSWNGSELVSLDGDNYYLHEEVEKYVWESDTSLVYWFKSIWK